jgi:hypothetical protein
MSELIFYSFELAFNYFSLISTHPRAIPFVAAINISSLSLNPFSVSKQTEKYSELDTWQTAKEKKRKLMYLN